MKRADDLFSDIEIFRTPEEMKLYFEAKKNIIKNDVEYSEMARLKIGLFKKFLEEFFPLYCLSQSKLCNKDSKLKIIIGNQGYDAIIINPNSNELKFEFTSYIDGKWEYEDAQRMNNRGYGDIRFNDHKDLNNRSLEYLNKILMNVGRKSKKSYNGVNIVFIVNTFDYFEVYNNDSQKFINELINEIEPIHFEAEKIYLMALNDRDISYIDNNIYMIKSC